MANFWHIYIYWIHKSITDFHNSGVAVIYGLAGVQKIGRNRRWVWVDTLLLRGLSHQSQETRLVTYVLFGIIWYGVLCDFYVRCLIFCHIFRMLVLLEWRRSLCKHTWEMYVLIAAIVYLKNKYLIFVLNKMPSKNPSNSKLIHYVYTWPVFMQINAIFNNRELASANHSMENHYH